MSGKYSWSQDQDARREARRPIPKDRQPIKRTGKAIAPRSAKRIDQEKIYRAERDLFLMLNKVCMFPGCNAPATDCHHSKGRTGALLTDRKWFKALCRDHHTFVELNPDQAKALKLSFNRLD